jgi:hypothetical protein
MPITCNSRSHSADATELLYSGSLQQFGERWTLQIHLPLPLFRKMRFSLAKNVSDKTESQFPQSKISVPSPLDMSFGVSTHSWPPPGM